MNNDSSITFNTSFYEEKHGKAPHHNTRGDWQFVPPRHLGKRPYLLQNMTYGDAKKTILANVVAQTHGEFILKP